MSDKTTVWVVSAGCQYEGCSVRALFSLPRLAEAHVPTIDSMGGDRVIITRMEIDDPGSEGVLHKAYALHKSWVEIVRVEDGEPK